ncbi:MAG: hypothetical protein WKF54_06000 [Nocardioidaceae bacterium]
MALCWAVAADDNPGVAALRPDTLAETIYQAVTMGHLVDAMLDHLRLGHAAVFSMLRQAVLDNGRPPAAFSCFTSYR